MSPLPIWQTIPLFLIIIGVLVVVHELGHFLTAKYFGIEAPEFGLGFPPRLWTFWKSGGWVQIQNGRVKIPRNFQLPEEVRPGTWVTYKTEEQRGRAVLTGITPVEDEDRGLTMASQVQNIDRGTIYTLNAIPFGGFVRMSGEDDPTAPNAFAAKPAWQRAIVLVAGVTMNFVLAFLIFTASAMWVPQFVIGATTTIAGILPNTPAAQADLRVNDTVVSINGVDIRNNREKMISELTANCGKPVALGVERPNPRGGIDNLTLQLTPRPTADLPCALGVQISQDVGAKISSVVPGSIIALAGLQTGDALVQIGDYPMRPTDAGLGSNLHDENDLAAYIRDHFKVRSIVLVKYIRDGVSRQVKVTIPEGLTAEQAKLGLGFHMDLPQAIGEASNQMYTALMSVPRTLREMVSNIGRGNSSGVVGPVGITQIVAEGTPSGGLPFLISLVGILSLNLAIFNLLPIPGLDGGRLVFVIAEMLTRGRKIDPQKEGIIHLAGFVVLLMFILVVSYFDVTRVLSGKSPFGP